VIGLEFDLFLALPKLFQGGGKTIGSGFKRERLFAGREHATHDFILGLTWLHHLMRPRTIYRAVFVLGLERVK